MDFNRLHFLENRAELVPSRIMLDIIKIDLMRRAIDKSQTKRVITTTFNHAQ